MKKTGYTKEFAGAVILVAQKFVFNKAKPKEAAA